jgi:Na+/melibiose symporter-like transporter
MLLSAFVMDYFPATGTKVAFELFGQAFSFRLYGYLIAFEITAISFILSGYVISFIKERKKEIIEKKEVVQNSFINLKEHLGIFLSDKILLILLIASTTSGLVQTMGNSFYGIFIYRYLNNQGFGGFMNVAVIFIIALFASIIGPYISRKTSIEYGKFSMLAFGTVLMAIMPLTFYYNPNLVSIAMGTLIGIIGASVTGVAHGLLTLEIIPEKIRQTYFGSFSLLISIPFLITTPISSYIAHIYGLRNLFLILGVMLLVIVLPLYFLVVIMHRNSKL